MAEKYGVLPTTVMDRSFSDFWMDAGVTAAVDEFRDDVQGQRRAAQTDAGAATPEEKEDLVDAQEARAERREQAVAPSPDEQMAALGIDVDKRMNGGGA